MPHPVVLEAYAGAGVLYDRCYRDVADGVAIEKNPSKTAVLAMQRPTWAVYEGDAVQLLSLGVGSHLAVNVLDVDPYGSPFPAIAAFLASPRPLPDTLHIVVNDGLRQKVKISGVWNVGDLREFAGDVGNRLYDVYLDVAKEKVRRLGAAVGYELVEWYGYYCGHARQMTHYAAAFVR